MRFSMDAWAVASRSGMDPNRPRRIRLSVMLRKKRPTMFSHEERVPGFLPQVTRVLALPFFTGRANGFGSDLPACPDEPAARQTFFDQTLPEAFAGALPRITSR